MNDKEQLKKRIAQTELRIKNLTRYSSNEVCEDLYNSLILQKAVMKKQLEDLNKNPLIESVKKGVKKGVKKILPRKEKLICDYFN